MVVYDFSCPLTISFGHSELLGGGSLGVHIQITIFYMKSKEADPIELWIFQYFPSEGVKSENNDDDAPSQKRRQSLAIYRGDLPLRK